MVREVVAFAFGRVGEVESSSRRTQGTPRRPSSIARISPAGPPPTMTTFVRGMVSRLIARRGERPDCGEERFDCFAREVARDEHDARAPVLARPCIERDGRVEYVLGALHH